MEVQRSRKEVLEYVRLFQMAGADSMAVLRTNSWRLSTRVEKRQVLH